MPELLFEHAKYSSWKETHNFDNCKLDRKSYGEFLANYIIGESDGFVLNLNGSWGAGKTEFLKRMYTHLISKSHPCIYIDAWESDFSKDPLTVVTSELLTQLKLFNFDIDGQLAGRELKKFFTKALKGVAVGTAGGLSKYFLGDSSLGVGAMQELLNEESEKYIDTITTEYHEQIDAINKIRENLTILANVLKTSYVAELPIVVLVDELDRCRPTYAIEMLEVIKHFFKTENFVFIVATDTEQLSHSVKAVYGQDFESKNYLKRFFDRKATLPTPNIEEYLSSRSKAFELYNNLNLYPSLYEGKIEPSIYKVIGALAVAYNLQVRDVDQLLNKFESCLRTVLCIQESTIKNQYLNYPALLIGLIEQDKYELLYSSRTKYSSPDSILSNDSHEVSKGFTVSNLIKSSMNNITYRKRVIRGDFGRNFHEESLPNSNELQPKLDGCKSQEHRRFIIDTINNNRYGNSEGGHKHWSWDDMKKIIELAGTIE